MAPRWPDRAIAKWLERSMPRGRRGGGLELSTTRCQEAPTPHITSGLPENVFSTEQKQQIAQDLTEAMVAILRVSY